jgi:hypothetical protein
MGSSGTKIVVDLFFIHATLGTAVLSWWFLTKKKAVLKDFGWGMLGYTLGLAAWTAVVLIRPTDLKPLILVGVVPFLLGSLAYAKAASDKFPVKASTLIWLVAVLIAATFIARTFFYPSDPYFSSKGLLFFGLKPVPIALYIATLSVSFLPAIRAAASAIKDKAMKSVMGIGLMVLYINAIILVSANDNTLLLINGVVLSLALLMLWVKALSSPATT